MLRTATYAEGPEAMPTSAKRFVSRLTYDTLALVLAGGRGSRLGVLTDWRTKPAVPFGGKFRIVDFTLSNCLNSGIRRIGVLTQYKSHALIQHLMQGWGSLNTERREFIDIIPAQQWRDDESWYLGTADAVFQCLDIIEGYGPEHVLILAGDHVYAMDYGEALAAHADNNADLTVACTIVPKEGAKEFGVMQVDESDRLIGFAEKPDSPRTLPGDPCSALVSMGIYVFSYAYLKEQLRRDAKDPRSQHDFGKDLIPSALANGDSVYAYRFRESPSGGEPYWRDVGTVDAYYGANLEVLAEAPPIDIHSAAWPIRTYQPQYASARFIGAGPQCRVENAMVSGGCIVNKSKLIQSVLFSNVKVGPGCVFQGVLALPGCTIGADCHLSGVILDNGCAVPSGTVIGADLGVDRERFHVSNCGIVVVNREMLGQDAVYQPVFAAQG
jgi:glucose-1-phosphate adenylyltransferase